MMKEGRETMAGNKFGAKKITDPYTGYVFDSRKEYNRWCDLRLMEKAGYIHSLRRQVKFELIPKQAGENPCNYIADFTYFQDGQYIVEDCKGYKRGAAYDLFVIKRKLMLKNFGIHVKET